MELTGKRIVVSAGGTQEPIDPVRYIGNRSSGKMGYALAEVARDMGAEVTLITAPTALPVPSGVKVVNVESVLDMKEAVTRAMIQADVLIMAAAPADYVVKNIAGQKIKKEKVIIEAKGTPLTLLSGLGTTTAEKFIELGINNLEDLSKENAEELALLFKGVSEERLKTWIDDAKELIK